MCSPFENRPYAQRHFRQIVEYARRNNPFYRKWITDPESVPVLDRLTFLEHNDEILNGYPVTAATSGSTGVPVRFSISPELAEMVGRDRELFVRWLGGRVRAVKIVNPYGATDDPDLLSINTAVHEQIAFIERRRREAGVVAITTYPTNAAMLAHSVLDLGVDTSYIIRFGMMSESVDAPLKMLVQRAFSRAALWITYSAREFGLIGATCPHNGDYYHLMAHRLGIELLDENGAPVDEGERGRVVVTDFFNRRSPFIRYDLGDHAVWGSCPCGVIKLPALKYVFGKTRGALLHRNGNRITFVDLSSSLRSMPGMRQFQVVQHSVERFTVRLVGPRELDSLIVDAFADHFGYIPSELEFEHVEWINREHNGKLHESICLC